ncbi:unnamed protein product [Allacma fusca]|uniref:Uncharacterized protein n=1 Tax=Allacma fusca TaxID=39272 RepID=A0A8J2LW39_9HEXA|nr:unnamed protein product [Allacma fusca]
MLKVAAIIVEGIRANYPGFGNIQFTFHVDHYKDDQQLGDIEIGDMISLPMQSSPATNTAAAKLRIMEFRSRFRDLHSIPTLCFSSRERNFVTEQLPIKSTSNKNSVECLGRLVTAFFFHEHVRWETVHECISDGEMMNVLKVFLHERSGIGQNLR